MEVKLVDHMGTDLSVVNAARVSFKKHSSELTEKDKKLIKYLAEHKHYSPFGHCFASFWVKVPIFVARQLVKHEYLRLNEVSRRYVDDEPEFYSPEVWRGRAEDKKQGSSKEEVMVYGYYDFLEESLKYYEDLITLGVAPEQARMVLPLSTYTEFYWSGSLDAFANMYNLRTGEGAQEETKQVALMIGEEMSKFYPVSWEALTNDKDHDS